MIGQSTGDWNEVPEPALPGHARYADCDAYDGFVTGEFKADGRVPRNPQVYQSEGAVAHLVIQAGPLVHSSRQWEKGVVTKVLKV